MWGRTAVSDWTECQSLGAAKNPSVRLQRVGWAFLALMILISCCLGTSACCLIPKQHEHILGLSWPGAEAPALSQACPCPNMLRSIT